MIRHVMRTTTWLLLPFVLPSLTGCTVIGYAAGREVDRRAPDLDTLSIAQLQMRPEGTPITVLLRDGGRTSGGLHTVALRSLRVTHQDLAATLPVDLRLPLPGETLRVTTAAASGALVFARLALPGERHWIVDRSDIVRRGRPVALFSPDAGAPPIAIPFDLITRMEWSDGAQMRGATLAQALASAGSADPRVVVVERASAELDSVTAASIRGIEAPRIKRGSERGVLLGLCLDVAAGAFLVAVARGIGEGLSGMGY